MKTKIHTTDIRKDIVKMMSFLNEPSNTTYSICYDIMKKDMMLSVDTLNEIKARHIISIRYSYKQNAILINAYNENQHNGDSYNEFYYTVNLNDFLETSVTVILTGVFNQLYEKCFSKEKTNIITKLVNDSLRTKFKNL